MSENCMPLVVPANKRVKLLILKKIEASFDRQGIFDKRLNFHGNIP